MAHRGRSCCCIVCLAPARHRKSRSHCAAHPCRQLARHPFCRTARAHELLNTTTPLHRPGPGHGVKTVNSLMNEKQPTSPSTPSLNFRTHAPSECPGLLIVTPVIPVLRGRVETQQALRKAQGRDIPIFQTCQDVRAENLLHAICAEGSRRPCLGTACSIDDRSWCTQQTRR